MDDDAFDTALIGAAFRLAGERGWSRVSVAAAARAAGLDLARARLRFPGEGTLLLKFGRMADRAALVTVQGAAEATLRDRLFELLMRRFDVLQEHRPGVEALLRALPSLPDLALLLTRATERSMGWMLDAAEAESDPGAQEARHGAWRRLRTKGLLGVWLWATRAWMRDGSEDLAATMAALDAALTRAEQVARLCDRGGRMRAMPDADTPPPDASPPHPTPTEGETHGDQPETPA